MNVEPKHQLEYNPSYKRKSNDDILEDKSVLQDTADIRIKIMAKILKAMTIERQFILYSFGILYRKKIHRGNEILRNILFTQQKGINKSQTVNLTEARSQQQKRVKSARKDISLRKKIKTKTGNSRSDKAIKLQKQ